MDVIQVIGISPGIAIGPVFHYERRKVEAHKVEACHPEKERARLEAALELAATQLEKVKQRAAALVSEEEAMIFEAQGMFLSDPALLEQVYAQIETERCNADYAWQQGTERFANMLAGLEDEYLSARAADVRDVGQRVLRLLAGVSDSPHALDIPSVVLAEDLTPSDTVTFDKNLVLGFCTAQGGPTSHVAILSRTLGIPAVVGAGAWMEVLAGCQQVLLDGSTGELVVDPSQELVNRYMEKSNRMQRAYAAAQESASAPATTLDGITIEVVANIGSPEESEGALALGAEGVGLFRTEFLFLDRETPPSEEEQVRAYQQVLQAFAPGPVVFRTLDIGGDKPAPYLEMPEELNPFLGLRGARLTIERTDLFQSQLRALLRAGAGKSLKIMFPMVDSLEDVRAARANFEQARDELLAKGIACAEQIELGIMIEVPSAALMADVLAFEVDFFSIGTNDLSQYTLAADRTNSRVSARADALAPAVLRLIRMVVEAAHNNKRWVGLCGELAGDPLATPVLVGLGIDEFSMNPRAIPLVKEAIRALTKERAQAIAAACLSKATATAVRSYLAEVAAPE